MEVKKNLKEPQGLGDFIKIVLLILLAGGGVISVLRRDVCYSCSKPLGIENYCKIRMI